MNMYLGEFLLNRLQISGQDSGKHLGQKGRKGLFLTFPCHTTMLIEPFRIDCRTRVILSKGEGVELLTAALYVRYGPLVAINPSPLECFQQLPTTNIARRPASLNDIYLTADPIHS